MTDSATPPTMPPPLPNRRMPGPADAVVVVKPELVGREGGIRGLREEPAEDGLARRLAAGCSAARQA